jgi:hypothetical protein
MIMAKVAAAAIRIVKVFILSPESASAPMGILPAIGHTTHRGAHIG